MRRIWISRTGGPEVLELREEPDPVPAVGEVLINVKACGVNFADVMARMGLYPDAPKLPAVVGYEVAGTTEDGSRVIAMTKFGGYADKVCVPATQLFPIPAKLSFVEAAAIPVQWLTAWHMLVELGSLRAGHKVLVHAAAGGVGTAALQICKRVGAEVIGTASPGKHERLRQMGITHAIGYDNFDEQVMKLTNGRGVDLALDAVGGESFRRSYKALAPSGRLMMFGASGMVAGTKRRIGPALKTIAGMRPFWPMQLLQQNKGVHGINMGHLWGEVELLGRELRQVLAGVEAGDFMPIVDAQVPFAEARKAHERLQDRQNFGKVVLVP